MISFRNVTYSYRQSGEPKSLDSVHLEIKNGECVLLCGKSGCGKTTMTRLLNGMLPNLYEGKLQGAVLLDGKNLFDLPMYEIAKRVGKCRATIYRELERGKTGETDSRFRQGYSAAVAEARVNRSYRNRGRRKAAQ